MKLIHVIGIVIAVICIDVFSKVYVKTHFFYGEEVAVIGNWFKLHFIENEGMAFGMKFGEHYGKLFLTLFRLVAVVWGFYFIQNTLIKQKYSNGLIFCGSLVLAGALGNSIDSVFFGKIFTESSFHVARFVPWGQGYGEVFHGKVVDMLYFPLFNGHYPSWVPIWGGEPFEFFRPVFNVADTAISLGVFSIFIFQKRLLKNDMNTSESKEGEVEMNRESVKDEPPAVALADSE